MGHRVTSAYATLRVPNDLGQEVLVGFYEGAILPASVNQDDLARHIRKGMVEKVKDAPAPAPAAPVVPYLGSTAKNPTGGQSSDDQPAERPNGNASREAWAEHATKKGAPESETAPVDQGGLSRDDLRTKYGS